MSVLAHAGGWDELVLFLAIPTVYGLVRLVRALLRRRADPPHDRTIGR